MASSKGQVTFRGRFPKGAVVKLIEVADEHVLRAQGGREIATKTVGEEDGISVVSFDAEVGKRYFVTGLIDGRPEEFRITGRPTAEVDAQIVQAPITPDRQRLTDGSWRDERPTKESAPAFDVGPGPSQQQVPASQVQRSDTPRGQATPVDTDAQEPVRRPEDVNGPVQMSDTETGEATEILPSFQRQEDTPAGLLQRSDTPHGVATPIPRGAIDAQLFQESSQARESRGEKTKAAAEPHTAARVATSSPKRSSWGAPVIPGAANDRDTLTGLDAMGQPLYPDAAAAVGLQPAAKPAEAIKGDPKDTKPAEPPAPLSADPPRDEGASKTQQATTGAAGKPRVSRAGKKSTTAKARSSARKEK